MRFASSLVGVLAIGLGGSWASADWLYFARGGQAELPVNRRGSIVEVLTPDGPLQFPARAFRAIIPGDDPATEYRARQAAARREDSAEAEFAAAWWALEHGLTPEAVAEFGVAATAPGAEAHAPLGRVRRALDRLDAPVGDRDRERLMGRLGGSGWSELRGRHVTLLHQASDPAAAVERLEVLERVVTSFLLSLAAQGTELPVPHVRLVSVWFARQADYAAFLHRADAAPFAETTQGYYHPTEQVVFAYDTRSAPDQLAARQTLERRQLEPSLPADVRADLDRRRLLLDLRWRSVDLGIAAHETIHQIVAASGLAARFDDFPHWLHEGFAAQFEVVRGGRWAGFGRINDFRLADWRALRTPPEIAPLLRDDDLEHGYHRDRYAASWALVYFLRKTRPTEFATFLDLLQTPRSSLVPDAASTAFTTAFGTDLATLEVEWRRYLGVRMTPLEAHARPGAMVKFR